jgi:amidohydrolase
LDGGRADAVLVEAVVQTAGSNPARPARGVRVTLTELGLAEAAAGLHDRVVAHRRALHRQPELAFAEHGTAAYIERVLTDLGVPFRRVIGTGIVATIRGSGPGCVGLRADMDALPVEEAPGRAGYRSEVPGVSHACGHDAHMAMLLGVAELLTRAAPLAGTVALYFQPGEEGAGGAAPMVAAGVLADPAPDAILGLHVSSRHACGLVALRSGPVTASNDTLTITVQGAGGHAAHPHTAVDPIPIAAQVVTAVQHIITREVDPAKPAVITFGTIRGGTKSNVIAPSVELGATLRAVDEDVRAQLLDRVAQVSTAIARAHRGDALVTVERGFAAGYNDPALTTLVAGAARSVVGDHRVVFDPVPSMGAEDFFAFGSTGIPVCMFRLGVANAAAGITAPHHSPEFDIDEASLRTGVAVFLAAVRDLLEEG